MAEAWTVSRTANGINVIDENGLPVCTRVGLDDANLIASAPRLAEQVRNLREALEGATSDLEDTLSELKLMNPKRQNHNEEARIQRFRTVLKATKEGA